MSTRDEIINAITDAQQIILGGMVRGDRHAEEFGLTAVRLFTELLAFKVETEAHNG